MEYSFPAFEAAMVKSAAGKGKFLSRLGGWVDDIGGSVGKTPTPVPVPRSTAPIPPPGMPVPRSTVKPPPLPPVRTSRRGGWVDDIGGSVGQEDILPWSKFPQQTVGAERAWSGVPMPRSPIPTPARTSFDQVVPSVAMKRTPAVRSERIRPADPRSTALTSTPARTSFNQVAPSVAMKRTPAVRSDHTRLPDPKMGFSEWLRKNTLDTKMGQWAQNHPGVLAGVGMAGSGLLGKRIGYGSGYDDGSLTGYQTGLQQGYGQGFGQAAQQAKGTNPFARLFNKYQFQPSGIQMDDETLQQIMEAIAANDARRPGFLRSATGWY